MKNAAGPRRAHTRSLDHLVIASQDVEAVGGAYEQLGFQVLPRMRHIEGGTCNRVITLDGAYVELLGDIEHGMPAVRDHLLPRFACGGGLSIVSLDSNDLSFDRELMAALGLAPAPILNARRDVVMPDGSTEQTDSRCFYVWREKRLYGSLFLSKHGKPGTIWISAYQRHPNTARRVTHVTYVSDQPQLDRSYFAAILGCKPEVSQVDRVVFRTARGEQIALLAPSEIAARFGDEAPHWNPAQPIYGVGIRYAVDDLDACRAHLTTNRIDYTECSGCIRVSGDVAGGVVTEFTPCALA